MIWALSALFIVYIFCLAALVYGFKKVKTVSSQTKIFKTRFSIVIPFRNEAENLPNLLSTLENLQYPSALFEIIFVNDASEDASEAIVTAAIEKSKFSIKLLQNKRLSKSPKKDAIYEAIKHSSFEWIVTTDADCKLPQNWLASLDAIIQTEKPVMVCGPVMYEANGSFIENFQQLDGLSLQAVTLGSFGLGNAILCNGANLAYQKSAFTEVNGFVGNDHIASGDDIFLLEKMKKTFPGRIKFLKSKAAIVSTKGQKDWKSVLSQRIRWASKTSKQKNRTSIFLGMLVVLVNVSILAIPFLMLISTENLPIYIVLLLSKIIADYLLILQSAAFFGKKVALLKFLLQPLLYAVLIVAVMGGSFSGSYNWKGRTFEKP